MIKDYVMKDIVSTTREATPMLFPFDPEIFWTFIRRILSEEIKKSKVNEAPRAGILNTRLKQQGAV